MSHFTISTLNPDLHRRDVFDCGVPELNRYLKEQASQDMRRLASGCWVLTAITDPSSILGFYTLSHEGIELSHLPENKALLKKLPRYPRLGAILLGRLAVSASQQGKGIGQKLLMDALHRSAQDEIPASLLVVDAKDAHAEAFYLRFGFERLSSGRLFYPMHALRKGLEYSK